MGCRRGWSAQRTYSSHVSRDQLLGRARRAVLAVAGTASGLGGRTKRRQADESSPTGRAPTAGLPPRIDREREPGLPPGKPENGPAPGLPPRIEHEQPTAGLPPRIERGAGPSHPPRIERDPGSAPEAPPRIERRSEAASPAVAVTDSPVYRPRHARPAEPRAEPAPAPEPEPDVVAAPEPAPEPEPGPEPVSAEAQQPAAVAPVRPDPLASPVKNVLRAHQRLAYVVLAVILVAAAGFWVLRVHQRIGEGALEAGITKQQHAPAVQCASLQSNGSAWACAVVYRAESVCLIARVSVLGSWSTAIGQHRCERVPRLAKLAPTTITAAMVGADIDRRQGRSDFVCGKLPSHKVRWACERPLETGGQCLVVRVIQWTSWNVLDGGKACAHDPKLQKALKRSSA